MGHSFLGGGWGAPVVWQVFFEEAEKYQLLMSFCRNKKFVLQTVVALLAIWPASVHACAACFGKSDSAMAKGMNMGIFALLGFIGCVLGGIVGVGVYFAMR